MTRLRRIVVPHAPHHVTQRGNRREPIFFEDGDQDLYRDLLAEQCQRSHVEIWAYCLMPNHVHIIAVPTDPGGLGRVIGEAHRRYTNFINARGRWSGHLFQSRFASVVMDDTHLIAGVRYVSLNPCAPGWSARRRIGRGRAFAPILRGATTVSSPSSPCSIACGTSRNFSRRALATSKPSPPFAAQRAPADRWPLPSLLRSWSDCWAGQLRAARQAPSREQNPAPNGPCWLVIEIGS